MLNLNHDPDCGFWINSADFLCDCGATRLRHENVGPQLPLSSGEDDQRKPAAVTAGDNRKEG